MSTPTPAIGRAWAARPGLRVVGLWRYPVKSLQGELLRRTDLDASGVVGDRRFAIVDAATGTPLSAKREPRLLQARARLGRRGRARISLPDGHSFCTGDRRADELLSGWLGRDVALAHVAEGEPPFVDDAGVHLLTTSSLRAAGSLHPDGDWDVRRFRPTLLLDGAPPGYPEDDWIGSIVDVDGVRLGVVARTVRCAMVGMAQPGLVADGRMRTTLAARHEATLGVYAIVRTGGSLVLGRSATVSD